MRRGWPAPRPFLRICTDRSREGAVDGERFSFHRRSSRPCSLLPAPRHAWLRRTSSTVRADGARASAGAQMAQPRRDARRNRGVPITSGTSRNPGRNFRLVSARRFLGSVGGRMGVHPAEFHYRVRARCALRSFQRTAYPDRNLLRRESCRDRLDSALVLSAREARHGGLVAMGDRGSLLFHNHCSPRRSCGVVRRVRARWSLVLWLSLLRARCGAFGNSRGQRSSRDRKVRRLPDTGEAFYLLPESRIADLWKWFGDCTISRERIGPEYWLA